VASWAHDNEGQVTNVTDPKRFEGLFQRQRLVTHGYDSMARLNSVQTKLATEAQQNPAWQSVISGVEFNAFGAVTSLNHLGVTESAHTTCPRHFSRFSADRVPKPVNGVASMNPEGVKWQKMQLPPQTHWNEGSNFFASRITSTHAIPG
jgi:hypothetical protein